MTGEDLLVALCGDPSTPIADKLQLSSVFGKVFALPGITLSDIRQRLGPEKSIMRGDGVTLVYPVDGGMACIGGIPENDFIRYATVAFVPAH